MWGVLQQIGGYINILHFYYQSYFPDISQLLRCILLKNKNILNKNSAKEL